ncbi:membrane protein [Mycobacterium antarcticum]|nr:membrane protein [Mycolicibacterium sp. TUM20984]
MFLVIGILGFVPGVTTHYDQLTVAGHDSGAALLGVVFNISVLHNAVHLVFDVAGLILARTYTAARWFLIGGAVVYLLLFMYGVLIDHGSAMNFIPVNPAENWLHLGLGVGMLALGNMLGGHTLGNGPASTPRPAL